MKKKAILISVVILVVIIACMMLSACDLFGPCSVKWYMGDELIAEYTVSYDTQSSRVREMYAEIRQKLYLERGIKTDTDFYYDKECTDWVFPPSVTKDYVFYIKVVEEW